MLVTIDIQVLIEEIQKTNPNVDQTSLKATLLDLIVAGKASPTTSKGGGIIPPSPKEDAVTVGYVARQPAPLPYPITQDDVDDKFDDGMEPMHPAEEDPLRQLAQEAMSAPLVKEPPPPRAAAPVPQRVVVTNKPTGPRTQMDRQAKQDSKEAKRKEMSEFANLSSKEIMERLTNSQLPRKKSGQNQFVDQGGSEPSVSDGDIEIG